MHGMVNCLAACVSVNDLTSEYLFLVLQDVRQGGVLSPWLYMCFNSDIPLEIGQTDNGITVNKSIKHGVSMSW